MSNQSRGLAKMSDADSPISVFISGVLILGSIAFLIVWALQTAYPYS